MPLLKIHQRQVAGQHDSFLNIAVADNTITAVRDCYASLFIDRAIKYRIDNGFSDMQVGLSVGIQLMVRTDKGSAGVIFEAYEEFSKFYALHPEVFSSDLKQRILNTATSISRIFIEDNKGVNQHLSELKTLIQLPGISKV